MPKAYLNHKNPAPKKKFVHESLSLPLERVSFVIFDLETTGGNPQKNGLTEIFAIKFCFADDQDKTEPESFKTFHSLVNPQIKIPPIVRRMTGIDNKMLVDAPVVENIFPEFLDFVGDACIVSHNVQGDLKFLRHFAMQTAKKNFQNFFLCTHLLVEKLVEEAPIKSLKGLAQHFELGNKDFHRAEADAFITLEIFKILVKKLQEKNIRTLEDALRIQNDKDNLSKIGWSVPASTLNTLPNAPGLFKLFDRERKLLFASSSFSVQKDIAKLQRSDQIPKSLAKIVLKTNEIQVERFSNLFEAMLAEIELIVSSVKSVVDPVVWHQRNLLFLCFNEGPENTVELEVAPLRPGLIAALGPVFDRNRVQTELEKFAREQQLVVKKDFIEIPLEKYQTVRNLLTRPKLVIPKKLSGDFFRQFMAALKKIFQIKHEVQMNVLPASSNEFKIIQYDDVFSQSGVLAVSCNSIGGFKLFPISQGVPLEAINVRGSNRENLLTNVLSKLKIRGMLEDLQETRGEHEGDYTLSESGAKKMALVQWWIQTQSQYGIGDDQNPKKDISSLFISGEELARIEKNDSK